MKTTDDASPDDPPHVTQKEDSNAIKPQSRQGRKRANGQGGRATKRSVDKRTGRKRTGYKSSLTTGYDKNGNQVRKWFSGKTQAEADAKRDQAKAKLSLGQPLDPHRYTIQQVFEQWLESKERSLQPGTLEDYAYYGKRYVFPTLGEKLLKDLTPLDLEKLYQQLHQRGLTRAIQLTHFAVFSVLEQAVRWNLIGHNVAKAISPPRYSKKEARFWTLSDVTNFLHAARSNRLFATFFLALSTGLRPGELRALRWEDVSLEKAEIKVCHSLAKVKGKIIQKVPKSMAGRRLIPIDGSVVTVLKHHLENQIQERQKCVTIGSEWHDPGLVFATINGHWIDDRNLARVFRNLQKRAGVPLLNLHGMRHTNASLLILKNTPANVVSNLLGHTDVAFTMNTYTHVFQEQRKEAAINLLDFPELDPETEPTDEPEDDRETSS
jgi:integrase